MSSLQNAQKTLAVKVRPPPEKDGLHGGRTLSRVYMNRDTLLDLKLKQSEPCYLWKPEEEDGRIEAVADLSLEKNLKPGLLQVSHKFQELLGVKLSGDLIIGAGDDPFENANSIILRNITNSKGDAEALEVVPDEVEVKWWEVILREHLFKSQFIFCEQTFENVIFLGTKRSFQVQLINGNRTRRLAKFHASKTVLKISYEDDSQHALATRPRLELNPLPGLDQALATINEFLGRFNREFVNPLTEKSVALLLSGFQGTGKTTIINCVANSGWGKVYWVRNVAKITDIRDSFKEAKRNKPSIVILDDIDSLVSKENDNAHRITSILEEELDSLAISPPKFMTQVIVIAATLDAGQLPTSLRIRSRFTTEVLLPIPDTAARKAILKSMDLPIDRESRDIILDRIGDCTHAYTAADLVRLRNQAYFISEKSFLGSTSEARFMTEEHITEAMLIVRPTAMKDVTLKPLAVKWDDIGGVPDIKKALQQAIRWPLEATEQMKLFGLKPRKGILLYGPPGCSKTLCGQAMATEMGLNFFAVKGAELNSMYVGESERAVREIFTKARFASPSIIFFDEIEAIGSKRESGSRSSGINVLTTLLNEMDGIEGLKGVLVLAATNKPEDLDLALLRPGRFDQLLYVAPPNRQGREEILRKTVKGVAANFDFAELLDRTEGFSGAELVGVCQAAGYATLEKSECAKPAMLMEELLTAVDGTKKQITTELLQSYEGWAKGSRGGRA
ncbi:putative ATPase family gene 2 protein [Calycina marina]|uniref:ATPase family gene 2 protein n=1 Tax=Calycina marina TaxID=1763456 RepID=A0A9P7Z3S2_9HELO|nr:putative ATPase family gene 2 protein [Calycina marina]